MYVLWTGKSCPLATLKNLSKMYGRILTIFEHSLTLWILIITLLYVQIVPQLISTEVDLETTDQLVHFSPNNRTNSDKMRMDAGKLAPTDKPRLPVATRRNNRQRKPGKLSDQINPFGLSETKVITEWKRTDPRVFYIDSKYAYAHPFMASGLNKEETSEYLSTPDCWSSYRSTWCWVIVAVYCSPK